MANTNDNPTDTAREEPAPRVLHIADRDHFTRFGRMFRELGLALNNDGVSVALATDDIGAAAELDGTPIVDYVAPALRGWRRWRLGRSLDHTLAGDPTVVHLWGAAGLTAVSRWTHTLGIPVVIHATSDRDVQRLMRHVLRPHERPIVCCHQHAERLRRRWPTLAGSVAVCPPAVLAPEDSPALGVRDHALGVLWTGVLDARSGVNLLIDAVHEVSQRGFDVQLVLIGAGPATHDVWQRVRRLRLQKSVTMTDGVRLWDQTLRGVDVFVLPARHAEFSLAPLLAMAFGKLVIAAEDQIADWLIPGETVAEFPPGSADRLVERLIETAQGQPAVRAVARRAAEYVREYHGVSQLAESLHAVYRDSVREQRAAGAQAG